MIIDFKPLKQLSIKDIYDNIPQETIYSYYLGQNISPDKLVKCCFHKDDTPSLGFYKSKFGNIRFKCFGCGEEGGAIEFVMKKQNLIFPRALIDINQNLGNKEALQSIINTNRISNIEFKESVYERLKIIPIYRNFNLIDKEYWESFGLSLESVLKGNIRPCKEVYYVTKDGETKLYGIETKNNPIYCIEISEGIYKIYRPLNESKFGKWFTNASSEDLQGIRLLSEYRKLLFITSSMKDALVLKELGYEAIAPSGEGVRIPDKVWDYLEATSDLILFFNDADKAGYKYTEKLAKEKEKDYIFIPEEYNIKDISDFVKQFGINKAKELMKYLLEKYE